MNERSLQSLISQPNQHDLKFRHEANARKKLPGGSRFENKALDIDRKFLKLRTDRPRRGRGFSEKRGVSKLCPPPPPPKKKN